MNSLKKKRIMTVFKYTWPFYLLGALLIGGVMYFIFGITHRVPSYKTMTLFVTGETKDTKKLKNDLTSKYEIKSFSCISANPSDGNYNSKLSIAGYNSADILILPVSKLNDVVVSAFGLELKEEIINEYYQGYTLYQQEDINYGIKLDKEKVSEYFSLPEEDCYMVLNGKSVNIGEYSSKQIKEHDNALKIVKDWGN